jgi:hypothetical protein
VSKESSVEQLLKIRDNKNGTTTVSVDCFALLFKSLWAFFKMAVGTMLCGCAFRDLWLWFVVPLGMNPITFWHALGLNALGHYITINQIFKDTGHTYYENQRLGMMLSLIMWGVGWVYHWCMVNQIYLF